MMQSVSKTVLEDSKLVFISSFQDFQQNSSGELNGQVPVILKWPGTSKFPVHK